MAIAVSDIVVDRYVVFVKTGKVGRIAEICKDCFGVTEVKVDLPSGRRTAISIYVLFSLVRATTALEVLALLGNEPEVA